jgi:hypothetical protein
MAFHEKTGRLPIFQLLQSSQFWISGYRVGASNRLYHIPATAPNEHPGHWASMGPDRRRSENDSVESRVEVLKRYSKILHQPNISTHPVAHDGEVLAIG